MSGGGQKTQKVETTTAPQQTTQTPWGNVRRSNVLNKVLKPWESSLIDQGGSIPFFPGQTYVGPSDPTLQGIAGVSNYLYGDDYLAPKSNDYLSSVLAGDYLNQGNPALAEVTGAFARDIGAATRGNFAGSGRRMGGPSEVQTFERTLADATAPYYFQDYARERGVQQEAAKMAPLVDQSILSNLSALINSGQLAESYKQLGIDEEMARYEQEQYGPLSDASRYAQALNILAGGGGTTVTTGGSSVQRNQGAGGGTDYFGAATGGMQALLPLLFFL